MIAPGSEAELSAAIAQAQGPIVVRGGGTRDIGRPCTGQVLCTDGLSGVRLYEPGALTLVVGAGTPVGDIETLLAGENQRLAFEPMDYRRVLGTDGVPTIGGAVATNASGPRRVQVGACRDHLLGVRFVDGLGRIVSNGGRVMKNVTGYDLVKLMAGSWGTLSVLTEVSLKVLPMPETHQTLRIPVPDMEAALRVLQRAMGTPYEVSGAAYLDGEVMLRVEGFEDQVAHRIGALQAMFGGDPGGADWAGIRDAAPFAGCAAVWRVHARPSRMAELIGGAQDARVMLDWGGALAWIGLGSADGPDMHQRAAAMGGHATLVKPPTRSGPVFQPEPPALAALTDGIRARFDPRGLLNPGRMT